MTFSLLYHTVSGGFTGAVIGITIGAAWEHVDVPTERARAWRQGKTLMEHFGAVGFLAGATLGMGRAFLRLTDSYINNFFDDLPSIISKPLQGCLYGLALSYPIQYAKKIILIQTGTEQVSFLNNNNKIYQFVVKHLPMILATIATTYNFLDNSKDNLPHPISVVETKVVTTYA